MNPLRIPLAVLFLAGGAAYAAAGQGADTGVPRAAAGAISGRVVDAAEGSPLAGAAVTLEPGARGVLPARTRGGPFVRGTRAVQTNDAGAYRFSGLPAGDYRLHVQRLGYRSATIEVELRGRADPRVSVGLEVAPIALEPLAVRATPAGSVENVYARAGAPDASTPGAQRVAAERLRQRLFLSPDARALTHADVLEGITLGETDLFRALQRLPGVTAEDDYSAALRTRGAPWDQTRVYFDGLPLFNPVHGAGLLAGVSPDAIGAAFLHPGVAPTSVGGGGAGTLDLRSRTGDGSDDVTALGALSLASARATVDGASADGRHRWMFSGRRTYLDWATRAAQAIVGGDDVHVPYTFYDLVQRYDHRLGESSALETSVLLAYDRVTGDIPDVMHRTEAGWGAGAARATFETPVGGLRTRHTLGFSGFGSRVKARPPDPAVEAGYSARDADPSNNDVWYFLLDGAAEPDAAGAAGPDWSAGYQLVGRYASYWGLRPLGAAPPGSPRAMLRTADRLVYGVLWGERRFRPVPALTVDAGARLEAGSAVRDAGAVRLAPRLAARYRIRPGLRLSAAAGRTYQYLQAVVPAGLAAVEGFHTEYLWLLAGDDVPALRSDAATLGAEAWLGTRWLASATAYARRSAGLAVPDPTPGSLLDRPLFVPGDGSSRGVELSLRRLAGRWTASVGYGYGVSEITAAGREFPAPADRRHAFDATALVRLGDAWRFGAAFTAMSGAPYTRTHHGAYGCRGAGPFYYEGFPLVEPVTCEWAEEPRVEAPGAHRRPTYRSLDLLADWTHAFDSWDLGAYLQVRNALFADNPGRFTGIETRHCPSLCGTRNGEAFGYETRDRFLPGLPILPLLGLRVSF